MASRSTLLSWSGRLPRFSRMREGGPGRLRSLLLMAGIALLIGNWGMRLMDRQGIDSAGPALVFLSVAFALFLVFWIVVKAGLRFTEVTFILSEKGIEITPSAAQKKLDRFLGILTQIAFLLTWKGTKWSAWHPFIEWNAVRQVWFDIRKREILVGGGPWDIRLICTQENFAAARDMIIERTKDRV